MDKEAHAAITVKELRRAYAAMEKVADLNCGCESGGGITDLEPGLMCGYHSLLDEIAGVLDSWEQGDDGA